MNFTNFIKAAHEMTHWTSAHPAAVYVLAASFAAAAKLTYNFVKPSREHVTPNDFEDLEIQARIRRRRNTQMLESFGLDKPKDP